VGGRNHRRQRHAVRSRGPARLLDAGLPVDLVVSQAARLTMIDETGWTFREARWRKTPNNSSDATSGTWSCEGRRLRRQAPPAAATGPAA
jgi:4-hydroxy-3-polyprenylbenzoate decarboxylase